MRRRSEPGCGGVLPVPVERRLPGRRAEALVAVGSTASSANRLGNTCGELPSDVTLALMPLGAVRYPLAPEDLGGLAEVLYFGGFFGLITFGLWLFCLVDVITSDDGDIRHLPKVTWLLIVLFFPLVGSIAWLAAGRPPRAHSRPRAYERNTPAYPEYDRPGRFAAPDPAADEEFLRRCRERAEEQRRKARGDGGSTAG